MEDEVAANRDPILWGRIRQLGATLDKSVIAESFGLIEPLVAAPAPADVDDSEHAYGPHARNRLDLYRAREGSAQPSPILLFVHGGGYSSGDKRMGPFFANIGRWAAQSGLVCAAMNYRLVPDHRWPCVQEDIRDAIRWLKSQAGSFGADPSRLVLLGHSAGAGHSASYLAREEFHLGREGAGVAGAILASGVYDLALAGAFGRSSRQSYYGESAEVEIERSSLARLATLDMPLAIVVAEHDPPELHHQALALAAARLAAGKGIPSVTRLCGHNHYTEILSVGLRIADQFHHLVLDFIDFDCAQAPFARG